MNFEFDTLVELIRKFPVENTCIKYLEEIFEEDNPVLPFDSTPKVYEYKNGRYKCKNTGKYFMAKTGIIFEGIQVKLQDWFVAI